MKLNIIKENSLIAIRSVRSNSMRTILTILIIAFGIMSLVGTLTAIDSIKGSLTNQFTSMGANSFKIESYTLKIKVGNGARRVRYEEITFDQANEFKERYYFPALISLSINASGSAIAKYKSEKTNPNVPVIGTDENYTFISGQEIKKGRFFTKQEVNNYRNIVVIGSQLSKTLFDKDNPLDKVISVGNIKYKVIGVLKSKGASMEGNIDNAIILPVTRVRQDFLFGNSSYTINVLPEDNLSVERAISEAEGIFRIIRGIKLEDESNFSVYKSDNLAKMLLENIKYVTIAATLIGIITLLGAAIGLMNIMLVSVSERTKEIGIRKAIGANSTTIKQQFLFEAIIIGQFGGILGIIFGITMGNAVSLLTSGDFIIPWIWIVGGVILCLFVSIIAGLMPAVKASRLDPIIALRYE